MKKLLLFFIIVFAFTQSRAQRNYVWIKTSPEEVTHLEKIRTTINDSERQRLYKVDINDIKKSLTNAPDKFSGKAGVEVSFPNISGKLEKYTVWENSNFEPELQAKFPDIRAYVGKSILDATATIHFSLSPEGIQTMVLRANNQSEFIEPYTNDKSVYILFDSKNRSKVSMPFNCATNNLTASAETQKYSNQTNNSSDQTYRTMRLALSCTGEYAQYYGGTVAGALAGMNATMTRVNAVYEIDLAVHLNIIADNYKVIYLDRFKDPYSAAAVGAAESNQFKSVGWSNQLQNTLTSELGNGAYDIGHLFGASGGGGSAGCIGCVCVDDVGNDLYGQSKGKGFTSPADAVPAGDNFDIDFVAHEMGHQLGAKHTFTFQFENYEVQVEPGSGSTIMGYAGVAAPYNIQDNSDPYFAYSSIYEIQTNLSTKDCPEIITITNTPPVANAGKDYIIPSETAYVLRGTATDADGNSLTYCWEQNNPLQNNNETGINSKAYATKLTGPNFRSFSPVSDPDRYMPEFYKVLYGDLSTEWESVSTVSRTLNFELTVRDNNTAGAQTRSDEMIVTSSAPYNSNTGKGAGPFKVTSQITSGITWDYGTSQTITWVVNNTTSLAGSTNVNIKLSVDGGVTFPYTLASNTPNDGNEIITVPATPGSSTCRIWIEPTGNIYYAINSKDFKVNKRLATEDFNLAGFSLYPNPNKGSFTVKFDSFTTNEIGISVHDLRGRNIFEEKYANSGLFSQNIKLNSIQSGVYIVTVKDGDKQVDKKIVVE